MNWAINYRIFLTLACSLYAQGLALASDLPAEQLFERISPSVWNVNAFDQSSRPLSQGSAVVVAPGQLITNCHVLAKASSFVIKRDNVSYGASLQHADTERDLCLITVRNFNAPAVETTLVETLRVGQKAYAIGNPRGLEVTLSDGLISGLRRSEDGRTIEFVQTTAPISPGSSGGGLFDGQGKLIGITTLIRRDSQNLNFAIPSSWIAEVPARAQAALVARQSKNTTTIASGANARTETRGAYYTGQELEYHIIDRMTDIRTPVVLRVSRFEGETIIFNGGQRVENMEGRVTKSTTRLLSELEGLNALGGWVTANSAREGSWKIETPSYRQSNIQFNLSAKFAGDTKLMIPAGEFDVSVFQFTGFRNISTSRGGYSTRYEATAWFSKALNRVVKFSVHVPGADGKIDEEIVLQKIK